MLFLPVFHWLELAEAPGWPLGGHVGGGTCTSTRPAGRLDPSCLLRVVVTSVPHTRPNTVLTLWNSVPGGRVLSGVSRLLSLSLSSAAIQLLRVHRDAAQEVHPGSDDRGE